MPKLRNPKHEKFAQCLAQGIGQADAYIQAGYKFDAGAASRLKNDPRIKARVKDLKLEKFVDSQRTVAAPEEPLESEDNALVNTDVHTTLKSKGVDIWWIVDRYKEIYEKAMGKNNFTAANKAIENLHKLTLQEIEAGEQGLLGASGDQKEDKVSLTQVTDLLREMRQTLTAKRDDNASDPAEEAKDITPVE